MTDVLVVSSLENPSIKGKNCFCGLQEDGMLICKCPTEEERNNIHERVRSTEWAKIILSIIVLVLVIIYCYRLYKNNNSVCLRTHILPLFIIFVIVVYIIFFTDHR